jgi:hypothetical protein
MHAPLPLFVPPCFVLRAETAFVYWRLSIHGNNLLRLNDLNLTNHKAKKFKKNIGIRLAFSFLFQAINMVAEALSLNRQDVPSLSKSLPNTSLWHYIQTVNKRCGNSPPFLPYSARSAYTRCSSMARSGLPEQS